MGKLNLPVNFNEAFQVFMELSKEDLESIFENAGKTNSRITSLESLELLSESTGVEVSKLEILFNLFLNLISVSERSEDNSEEIIKNISQALESRDIEVKDSLKTNLQKLFNNKNSKFYSKVKALLIASEASKIYAESQIITDFRPVFGEQVDKEFIGGVVFHKLKLTFIESGDKREAFITLDSNDLTNLKNQIIRAEKKDKAIKNNLSGKNIDIFEI